MGCVNCISTNTRHTCGVAKALNDRLVQRRGEMKAEEDKEKEEMGMESFRREREAVLQKYPSYKVIFVCN